jgi:hypothetical protein
MCRAHRLHGMAALWLIAGGLAGIELMLWDGLVRTSQGRLPTAFPQYKHGHPYDWLGLLVVIVAIVGASTLPEAESSP